MVKRILTIVGFLAVIGAVSIGGFLWNQNTRQDSHQEGYNEGHAEATEWWEQRLEDEQAKADETERVRAQSELQAAYLNQGPDGITHIVVDRMPEGSLTAQFKMGGNDCVAMLIGPGGTDDNPEVETFDDFVWMLPAVDQFDCVPS